MKVALPVLSPKRRVLRSSVSKLKVFTNECERLAALDVLYDSPGSPAQAHGTRVHAAIAARMIALRDGTAPPPVPEGFEGYVAAAEGLLKMWGGTVLEVEVWISSLRGLPWAGRLDLVVDTPRGRTVVDWKTCRTTTWAKSASEARRSLQLQAYCLSIGVTRAGFVYLPLSAQPKEVFVEFSSEELSVAYRRIEQAVKTWGDRWEATGLEVGEDEYGNPKLESPAGTEFDLSPFALAGSNFQWCGPKCRQWDRCLGKSS